MTEILKYLIKFKLLSLDQLILLIASFEIDVVKDLAYLLEQKLAQELIYKEEKYYAFTKTGVNTIYRLTKQRPRLISQKLLPIYLPHRLGVNKIIIEFILELRSQKIIIYDYQLEEDCYIKFNYQARKLNLTPDAQLIFLADNKKIHLLLEFDRGTMSANQLRLKVQKYEKYFKSYQYKEVSPYLPLVNFILIGNDNRRLMLTSLIRKIFQDDKLRSTFIIDLDIKELLAII